MLFFLGKIKKTKAKILGVEYLNGNMFSLDQIDTSFTLFIDRDGVLNHEKKEDYVRNWEEFEFYDGSIQALSILYPLFKKVILVTNQKGVGKGLMSLELHQKEFIDNKLILKTKVFFPKEIIVRMQGEQQHHQKIQSIQLVTENWRRIVQGKNINMANINKVLNAKGQWEVLQQEQHLNPGMKNA